MENICIKKPSAYNNKEEKYIAASDVYEELLKLYKVTEEEELKEEWYELSKEIVCKIMDFALYDRKRAISIEELMRLQEDIYY